MDQFIYNEILPPLIFFVIFTLAFSILELLVICLLNRLWQSHWEFMIDVVIRLEVHHGKVVKYIVLILLAIVLAAFLVYTPLIDVLVAATPELKIFAILLALMILLIYMINVRKSTKLDIEKKIYSTIFFIISLPLYIIILVIANDSYGVYAEYVRAQIVKPAVMGVESVVKDREEKQLLDKFRQSYLDNECTDIDYTEEEKKGRIVTNFVLMASEPELAFDGESVNPNNPKSVLKGKKCTDGKNIFLLTGRGDWYWVIEEYLK